MSQLHAASSGGIGKMKHDDKPTVAHLGVHPFVGSRPFQQTDSAFYFGREREASQLANMTAASSITVLYGESGTGKSSLVNTRLEMALERIEPEWTLLYFNEWQVAADVTLTSYIATQLRLGVDLHVTEIAKSLIAYANNAQVRVVLILDQFEEYFIYRNGLVDEISGEIAKLANRHDGLVSVLLSLRSDGLFLLDSLRLRIPHIFNSMFRLEGLSLDAAAEAVVGPIRAYNEITNSNIEVPETSSALVLAIIRGSQKTVIVRHLSKTGQGTLASRAQVAEVVLPFLQVTMDALWTYCIFDAGQSRLSVEALRKLAGLRSGPSSVDDEAVGIIVQRYVDQILCNYSGFEQTVCALMFERMVLPSGQKVSVQLDDLGAILEEKQRTVADRLLKQLSTGSSTSLIKRVASPFDGGAVSYQIVHDAMAVPILDWVERFKRAQRIRSAVFIRTLTWSVFCVVALMSLTAWYATSRADRVARLNQMLSFARLSPISGFRLPILLSLSAWEQADGQWWWLFGTNRAKTTLADRLVHSPRYGGSFAAAGVNLSDGRVAWLDDNDVLRVCDLSKIDGCGDSGEVVDKWQPDGVRTKSRSQGASGAPVKSVGFVRDLPQPVVVSFGIIHFFVEGQWRAIDVADILSDDELSGFVFVDVGGWKIRVTSGDWRHSTQSTVTLIFQSGSSNTFVREDTLQINWGDQNRLVPLTSASGLRAASLYVEDNAKGSEQVEPCQKNISNIDPNANLPRRVVTLTLWATHNNGWRKSLCSTPTPLLRGGMGFSNDESYLGILTQTSSQPLLQVYNVDGGSLIVQRPIEALSAGGSRGGGGGVSAEGPQFTFGTLALTKEEKQWRFAWQTPTGIRIEPRDGADTAASGALYLYGSVPPPSPPLLAWRLTFSDDGSFLSLQSMDIGEKRWTIMVWDLRPEWKKHIGSLATKPSNQLKELACRIASFDPSARGNRAEFSAPEIAVWNPEYFAPCEL